MEAMRQRFSGKVAVVTGGGTTDVPSASEHAGGASGIGAAISTVVATEGGRVAVLDRNPDHARRTVEQIEAVGGAAMAVRADVTSADECQAAIDEVVAAYGHIDILVNNAATRGTLSDEGPDERPAPTLLETDEAAWDRTMDINVKGMVLMAKAVVPHLADGAAIVNIGSTGAIRPLKGTAAYAVSKGAVIALTYAMAVDLAPIRANCVSPGRVWTRMILRTLATEDIDSIRAERGRATLLGSEGTAFDIATAAAFLASDEARWITGQHLMVDGGSSLLSGETPRTSGWTEVPAEPVS
jgi:NAD(P)-dependent dehydrogenase (short-subunit alcohol dehydrogenase family)